MATCVNHKGVVKLISIDELKKILEWELIKTHIIFLLMFGAVIAIFTDSDTI